MFRLVVNPGTDAAWEVPLPEGVHTLGRGPDNTVVLEHGSVSRRHCELHVTGDTVRLRDCGSTAGSFVGGELVEEAALAPGARFRLGQVELELVSDQPPVAPPPVAAAAAVGSQRCRFHPRALARWRCPRCGQFYCELCVAVRPGGKSSNHFCRPCGVECEPVVARLELPVEAGFFASLPGAFSYPFQGSGLVLLAVGGLFFLLLKGARFVAAFGGLFGLAGALILTVFMTGYLFNYAKRIVASTAGGENHPPDWPELSDPFEDVLVPFGQFLALVLLCFGPAIVVLGWEPFGEELSGLAALGVAALGALVFPMGMMALAMLDRIGALNPVLLVISFFRIPLQYLVAAAVFEVIMALYWFGGDLLAWVLPLPILPAVVFAFVSLYLLAVGMRILGLLYR
ncbi:MAG: FHA domain-containing protein, partial [Verrucomicrobiae bacterium]|nr:FHA domain-containing protein [Verrucomicrobiae bacterium]